MVFNYIFKQKTHNPTHKILKLKINSKLTFLVLKLRIKFILSFRIFVLSLTTHRLINTKVREIMASGRMSKLPKVPHQKKVRDQLMT